MRKFVATKVTVGYNTYSIMQCEHHGQVSFMIRSISGKYIGKTTDGGYKSKASAVRSAKNLG